MKKLSSDQLRNLIFGAEDSIVSTVGVLFGIASVQEYSTKQVLIVGLVLIVVEALSMGVGSFLSESSAKEQDSNTLMNPVLDGIIMFFSYLFTGFVIVAPYATLPIQFAKYVSVGFAVTLLFLLGFSPKKSVKSAFRMVLVAGTALVVAYLIANTLEVLI